MYENENNGLTNGNESGNVTDTPVEQGQWNNTSAYRNQDTYNASNVYGGGAYSNSGSRSYSGSYNSGTTGSYSNNSSTGTTGSYSNGGSTGYSSGTYGTPSYSYNQSSYSYNQNGQPSYGTYQYNANAVPPTPQEPVKKKHTLAKVIAAICILTLLVGGVGFAYTTVSRHMGSAAQATIEEQTQQQAIEDKTAATENETSAEAKAEAKAESKDAEIKTTTVTGTSMAVVTDVTAVVEEVMPAMVMIHNNYTASASYFGYVQKQEATASGSGIIVGENDSELLIATNYHVVEGADSLEVIFSDDSTVEAAVKGTDSTMDLAVIAVTLDDISASTKESIKVATLGDSNALKLGEPAIAIGNALGYGQSVTTGVISAVNREVEITEGTTQTFIQTDAAINPGNSGGALLNLQGEVIGINSNKIGGDTVEGMGYAIPISTAQPIIDKLMNEQTLRKVASEDRGYIGISGVSVTSDVSAYYGIPQGVYVAEITSGGGAEAAGLQKGDVITEFDGMEIASMDDLQTRLQYYAAGTEVTVTIMRSNGQEYSESTFNVTLGAAPQNSKGADSNAGEDGGAGQYDGVQQPAMPGGKSGMPGQQGGEGGGH